MINVTMEQIVDFRNNGDFFDGTNLPLKVAYKLNKIRKATEKESEFYSEKFQEILNNYAKKDKNGELVFSEEGDQIMIKEDMIDECNKALTDLQNLEVQIENYGLSIDDFGEDLTCTPDQLAALMPFIE
jgi:uncharacterized protein YnzC (UPF0291/DUF896 family)